MLTWTSGGMTLLAAALLAPLAHPFLNLAGAGVAHVKLVWLLEISKEAEHDSLYNSSSTELYILEVFFKIGLALLVALHIACRKFSTCDKILCTLLGAHNLLV